jgi:hypothetical protein
VPVNRSEIIAKSPMQQLKRICFSIIFGLLVSNNANASDNSNMAVTNVGGLVVKNILCTNGGQVLNFNVSNRSNSSVTADLIITMFDSDNDPINSATFSIDVGPVSGQAVRKITNCSYAVSYAARIAS